MPFTTMKELLADAYKRGTCAAAFNCFNYESIKIVINAGERLNAPVIVMLYPALTSHIPLSTFAGIVRDLAEKSACPVAIHLDHCDDVDLMITAVKAGFQSVIVDASRKPYDENVALTRRAVKALRPLGADIEAELGVVGSGSVVTDYTIPEKYTDPTLAARFAADTEIDCLAVAIGNAHGNYAEEPNLNIAVLKEINRLAGIPLALHGGSGIPDGQLAEAVKNGVAKANFGTAFVRDIYEAQARYVASGAERKGAFGLLKAGEDGGTAFAEGRIRAVSGL